MTTIDSPFMPVKATLRSVEPMAVDNYLFEFSISDGELANCQPGQFVQLWVPGVGECPISVCSGRPGDRLQLTVRQVGRVTKALFQLSEGDWVGLRGPFGHGFPVEQFKNKSVCMIAGGLGVAPIRSLYQYVLDHREDFGKLILIYGMKHSDELLFRNEFKLLLRRRDVDVFLAAEDFQICPLPQMAMTVGRVTDLLKMSDVDSSFEAAICGPPIMYKYVIRELRSKGVADENIWLSLERHMKCGIGKCGHCYIGGKFTCKAGPVFQLTDLALTPEVIECDDLGGVCHAPS